jgi:hypothetical protein
MPGEMKWYQTYGSLTNTKRVVDFGQRVVKFALPDLTVLEPEQGAIYLRDRCLECLFVISLIYLVAPLCVTGSCTPCDL